MKVRITVSPESSAVPVRLRSISVANLESLLQQAQCGDFVVVDRGHRFSSGLSEVSCWFSPLASPAVTPQSLDPGHGPGGDDGDDDDEHPKGGGDRQRSVQKRSGVSRSSTTADPWVGGNDPWSTGKKPRTHCSKKLSHSHRNTAGKFAGPTKRVRFSPEVVMDACDSAGGLLPVELSPLPLIPEFPFESKGSTHANTVFFHIGDSAEVNVPAGDLEALIGKVDCLEERLAALTSAICRFPFELLPLTAAEGMPENWHADSSAYQRQHAGGSGRVPSDGSSQIELGRYVSTLVGRCLPRAASRRARHGWCALVRSLTISAQEWRLLQARLEAIHLNNLWGFA